MPCQRDGRPCWTRQQHAIGTPQLSFGNPLELDGAFQRRMRIRWREQAMQFGRSEKRSSALSVGYSAGDSNVVGHDCVAGCEESMVHSACFAALKPASDGGPADASVPCLGKRERSVEWKCRLHAPKQALPAWGLAVLPRRGRPLRAWRSCALTAGFICGRISLRPTQPARAQVSASLPRRRRSPPCPICAFHSAVAPSRWVNPGWWRHLQHEATNRTREGRSS